jgi:hypothetical protein
MTAAASRLEPLPTPYPPDLQNVLELYEPNPFSSEVIHDHCPGVALYRLSP